MAKVALRLLRKSGGVSVEYCSPNPTNRPFGSLTASSSRITAFPRTIVAIGRPVTRTPADSVHAEPCYPRLRQVHALIGPDAGPVAGCVALRIEQSEVGSGRVAA